MNRILKLFSIVVLLLQCCLFNSITASLPTKEQVDRFNEFVEKCHNSHPNPPFKKPRIYADLAGEMGVGTFASENIKKEEIYMFMPWECVMSVESFSKLGTTFSKKVLDYFTPKNGARIDDFHIIMFYLLHEKSKGDKSLFFPYIDLLPKKFDIPYYWDEIELNFLKGSEIIADVYDERNKIRNNYNRIKSQLIDKNKGLFSTKHFSYQIYEWAYHILNSRTIWVQNVGNVRSLIPLLDAVNCKELHDKSRLHMSTKDLSLQAVITKSPDRFTKGEQVFENYGSDNHQNFFSHGFVLRPNSHNCVNVRFELEELTLNKKINNNGLPSYQVGCIQNNKPIPDRLSHYIQSIAKLTGLSFESIFYKGILNKIKSYPTTLANDLNTLQHPFVIPVKRMQALDFLVNEKEELETLEKTWRPSKKIKNEL